MPPLLFVHGAWHGAWCWEEHFLRYFGDRGWWVRAIDLRGHGAAPGRKRLRWTRVAEYVADVAEAAAALPEPPVVIGHAMGGLVVQKYLETHTAPAAVLVASVPPSGALMATLRVLSRHPLRFLKANLTMSLWPIVETPELAREMFFRQHDARVRDQGAPTAAARRVVPRLSRHGGLRAAQAGYSRQAADAGARRARGSGLLAARGGADGEGLRRRP